MVGWLVGWLSFALDNVAGMVTRMVTRMVTDVACGGKGSDPLPACKLEITLIDVFCVPVTVTLNPS